MSWGDGPAGVATVGQVTPKSIRIVRLMTGNRNRPRVSTNRPSSNEIPAIVLGILKVRDASDERKEFYLPLEVRGRTGAVSGSGAGEGAAGSEQRSLFAGGLAGAGNHPLRGSVLG